MSGVSHGLSFRKLHRDAGALAGHLLQRLGPGRRPVAVKVANPFLHGAALVALARSGLISSSLPAGTSADEALRAPKPDVLLSDESVATGDTLCWTSIHPG